MSIHIYIYIYMYRNIMYHTYSYNRIRYMAPIFGGFMWSSRAKALKGPTIAARACACTAAFRTPDEPTSPRWIPNVCRIMAQNHYDWQKRLVLHTFGVQQTNTSYFGGNYVNHTYLGLFGSQRRILEVQSAYRGVEKPHKHKDPTKHDFWSALCIGPLNQDVRSLCLCGHLGPQLSPS